MATRTHVERQTLSKDIPRRITTVTVTSTDGFPIRAPYWVCVNGELMRVRRVRRLKRTPRKILTPD